MRGNPIVPGNPAQATDDREDENVKALVFHGARDVRVENVPDPQLTDARSAVVRITRCGICGSDLHPYHAGASSSGFCIGHEAVGEVVEVGREVSRFRTGDRVIVAGSIGCGECSECRQGRVMTCLGYPTCRVLGQGMHGLGGCQAEAIEVPVADTNLVVLPDGISDAVGIMMSDNLATGWAAAKAAGARPGASIAVIGLGAVGLSAVMAAFALGAERVFAVDLLPERRARAAAFGAVPVESDPAATIREATGGYGVDGTVDAVGFAGTLDIDIWATRRGGKVVVVGFAETPTIPIPLGTATARNLTFILKACSVQPEWPELFAAIADGRLDAGALERLVTHDLPLSAGAEAYELFDTRRDGALKVLLTP